MDIVVFRRLTGAKRRIFTKDLRRVQERRSRAKSAAQPEGGSLTGRRFFYATLLFCNRTWVVSMQLLSSRRRERANLSTKKEMPCMKSMILRFTMALAVGSILRPATADDERFYSGRLTQSRVRQSARPPTGVLVCLFIAPANPCAMTLVVIGSFSGSRFDALRPPVPGKSRGP
jgi:hypothetical protein